MSDRKRRIPIVDWPTPDWEDAHIGFRFIKATFRAPVSWVSGLQIKGAQHVPDTGGVLLAVNHFSWADPILVGAAIHRPPFYLAKESVFRNPIAAKFFSALGQIKVNREVGGNEDAIGTAVEALERGLIIGVFPEGTRSRPGEVKRGRTGIARIAARANVPVIPIGIDTSRFWPKHAVLPKLGEKVYVNIGAPMRFDLKPEDADDRQLMRNITDDVMERITELLAEAAEAREAGEKWA